MIEKVSVSDTFEMYWYCIVSVHRYIWQKVAVSAHRYILKVSTKGLDEMIPIATVLDLTEIIPHYEQRVVVEYQIGIFLRQCH